MTNTMNIFAIDTLNYDHEKIKTKTFNVKENDKEISYTVLSSKIETLLNGEMTENPYPNYRSVIMDGETKDILCIAPPSSMTLETFAHFYQSKSTDENNDIMINELIEGTMINLFYDFRISLWVIATRTSVGCNYWYTRTEYGNENANQMTFREMFFDAIHTADLQMYFETYNKNYCYSFVLQHPENHIVLPIQIPMLFLVSVYEIIPEMKNSLRNIPIVEENPDLLFAFEHMKKYKTVFIPQRIYPESITNFNENLEDLANMYAMGIMVTHLQSGNRFPIVNKNYEANRKIRGNNANLQYHFFTLLQSPPDEPNDPPMKKIHEFLFCFPKYTNLFSRFYEEYQDFITSVHQAYFAYYIKKERDEIPKKYFLHASRIHHEIYVPEKRIIKRAVVAEYFRKMTPMQLMYYTTVTEIPKSKNKENENIKLEMDDLMEPVGSGVSV